jgi:Cytochrome P460
MINMVILKSFFMAVTLMLAASTVNSAERHVQPAPNGIEMPKYYKNWQLIGVSHRTDKNSLRAILGNAIAVKAAQEGQTKPWPEGAILAKLAWKDSSHPLFPAATVPSELQHVEFMIKDSKKYASTQGWGFARWLGMEQKPYGNNADFAQECSTCHLQAKENGYVFTRIAPLQ